MPKATKPPKKADDDTPKKKRGNQGDFHSKQLEFLQSMVDKYCVQSDEGATRTWWKEVWEPYWKQFPWDLPLDQEPPEDLAGYDKPDSELSEEEKARKAKVITDTEAKIKRWFSYVQRSTHGGGNPWAKFMAQIRQVDDRAPKCLATYQVYMQDEAKNARINDAFQARFPDRVGKKNTIKERSTIAREFLELEDEDVKADFRKRGEDEYQEAMVEYKNGGGVEAEVEHDAEARRG
ncbi:hypothetical protein C8R45DRAFT_1106437 [Mycena sanguinolenta]|nr:hypothetical protein C8R45DRAFT_1106437 [Mycena sanguinolenta]